jgi:hypothetical protein
MPATPGPWFVFGNGHCVGGPFSGVGGEPGQATAGVAMCGMRLRTEEECEANARLIAAAPELLAVVNDLVSWFGDMPSLYRNHHNSYTQATRLLVDAQAALDKATEPSEEKGVTP